MTQLIILRRVINLLRDIIFCALYINTAGKPRKGFWRQCAAMLFMLALLAMYTAEDGGIFSYAIIRILYRALCLFLYALLSRPLNVQRALYAAFYCDIVCTITHNLFLTPLTRPYLLGTVQIFESEAVNTVVCLVAVNIITLACYLAVYFLAPVRHMHSISFYQWVVLATAGIGSLYLNSTLRVITDAGASQSAEFSVYSLILQIALLLCLVFIEQLQYNQYRSTETRVQLITAQSMLDNIHLTQENDQAVKRMGHDLKNHMLTLRLMLDENRTAEAQKYIDSFLQQLPTQSISVQTGNVLLDALFTEKLGRAEAAGITTTLTADFSALGFIEDIDLCILFGNALDNACEACAAVQPPAARWLDVRSTCGADCLLLSISNSSSGAVNVDNGLPQTTKKDRAMHGMGLTNIKHTLAKYGGVLTVSTENKAFKLSMLIPLK